MCRWPAGNGLSKDRKMGLPLSGRRPYSPDHIAREGRAAAHRPGRPSAWELEGRGTEMTTTFVTRTADLMPALQPAQPAVQALSCMPTGAPVEGTGMSTGRSRSYAAARTGLLVDVITPAQGHVAVIGTRQVSPVLGSTVPGSVVNGSVLVGTAVFGEGDVPALRTWRPPV